MLKTKLALALAFQLRFDNDISNVLGYLFNAMIGYFDHKNQEPDIVLKA